ncbi:hypothetical protein KFK09_010146 [Dendrobium nobile]|uniref:Uncharacterized protein n=1 Tax=Dendrobium nobile TaxID=94219 RepID=A0A8T3BLC5_DENNO|nr:hypothetical protein KFK09_010145 [Dendrobium nobile]KAI0514112.1 hypothetical protein KFK09_010146 [Dendrobium nobile]
MPSFRVAASLLSSVSTEANRVLDRSNPGSKINQLSVPQFLILSLEQAVRSYSSQGNSCRCF